MLSIKIIFSAFLISLIGAFTVSADHVSNDSIGDMRIAGMSGAYTAIADDHNALFYNPAGLGTLRTSTLGIFLHYRDSFESPYFKAPSLKPEFYYAAPGWGVSISSAYNLTEDDNKTYTIDKINNVDIGFGLNLGMFSLGAAIHASKIDTIDNVTLEGPSSPDFLMDFITQVFMNTYNGSGSGPSEESVLVRAGFLFDSGIFSLGLHHNSIFDVMAWSDRQELPSLETFFEGLHVGVSFRNSRLNRYGQRNLLRVRGALDIEHIGSDEDRKLQVGIEAGLHITETNKIAVRAGYSEYMPRLEDLLYGAVNPSKGTVSLGAGIDLLILSVQAAASIPAEALTADEAAIPSFGISAGLKF